jgi:hypothetical protein
LSLHFNLPSHSISNLTVQIIDIASNTSELDTLEHYWIHRLQTTHPYGLNCKS